MKLSKAIGLSCVLLGVSLPAIASAQTSATGATNGDGSHATGLLVQGRLQTQSSLLSLGGPGFMVGYQAQPFAVGLQLGLTRVGLSATPEGEGETSASVMLYQLVPTAMFDVWRSADGRARANLIGGVGFGRASISAKGTSQECTIDGTGNEVCTNTPNEQKFGASFVPVMLGLGGDYYLSRNFALGLEGGFQGVFVTGVDSENNGAQADIAASANMQLAYGVLRATLVLGD
ncbi:MAG TPA: hypothetical protein VG937_06010 [Polyangiaceae bacterium]|nr:hypothetical protein [Polyangiaceae bacterium]